MIYSMTQSVKRAVLIGINYFGSSSELAGCIADITNVQAHLITCGFSEFMCLKDTPGDNRHQLANSPTRANIISALTTAIARCKSGDTLYIHYSGHGDGLKDDNGDEVDGQDECLCPVDYNFAKPDYGFIRDDELNRILVTGLPDGVKLRVVFDCCHSGSALDLPYRQIRGKKFAQENSHSTERDIVFISGCRDDQTSADANIDGDPSGALTWALLKSLNDVRASGKNAAKFTWKDLSKMIRLRLLRGGYEQQSQMGFTSQEHALRRIDLV
jgi:hypothetical protein